MKKLATLLEYPTFDDKLKSAIKDLDNALAIYNFSVKEHISIGLKTTNDEQLKPFTNPINFLSLKICKDFDLIKPNFHLNPNKKVRGIHKGDPLSKDTIRTLVITKQLISRLVGQVYCLANFFIEPLLASLKIYFANACKLTEEWKQDISKLDSDFTSSMDF